MTSACQPTALRAGWRACAASNCPVILEPPEGLPSVGRISRRLQMHEEGVTVDDPYERFAALYDRHYRSVVRYALQHADQASAEDAASEVFLIAWRQLAAVPEPALPWLLGVARNLLRKQAMAGRRRQELARRIAALTGPAQALARDTGEQVVERTAALDALATMSRDDVETLTLVTWHGLDIAEAAAVVGCSPRAFTVRLHRARRRLAMALEDGGRSAEQSARRRPPDAEPAVTSFRSPSSSTARR
jgi:RNA polymerase sigma factor (sigma-70 family)